MSEALLIANPAPPGALIESEEAGRSILAKLPEDWRQPVAFFALAKLYLIRSRGPLVTNLLYWRSKGLELEDVKRVFRRLCDPDVAREHNFENQLMADMAGMVADLLRRRRGMEEAKRRREEGEAARLTVGLADSFGMPQ